IAVAEDASHGSAAKAPAGLGQARPAGSERCGPCGGMALYAACNLLNAAAHHRVRALARLGEMGAARRRGGLHAPSACNVSTSAALAAGDRRLRALDRRVVRR